MPDKTIIKRMKPRGPNRPKPGLTNPELFNSFVNAATGGEMYALDKKFYSSVGIRRKRWGLLTKGILSPEVEEIVRVARYFEKRVFFNSGMIYLELFNDDSQILRIEL